MEFQYPQMSAYEGGDDSWRIARLRAAAYLIWMKLRGMEDVADYEFERVCSLHDDKGTLEVETYFDGGRNPILEQVLLDVWDILDESPSVLVLYRDADEPDWLDAKGLAPGDRFDMTVAERYAWRTASPQ